MINAQELGQPYGLKTREDFVNFDIENIWKEMEQIGRHKQTTDDMFKDF